MADPTNAEIAAALDELGDLYELDGAVSYRVIAYRNAARAVRESSVSIIAMTRQGRVTTVPGIGKTLEEKLRALDATGEIPALVKLRGKFPPGLIEVMHLPGFGAKRARKLFDELGVDSLDALRAAVEAGKVRELRGFGLKAEMQLKETLASYHATGGPAPRVVLSRAEAIAGEVLASLREHPASDRVEAAGSLRRRADSVKDLDIIATASDPRALARTLGELELVESVQSSGDAGARVTTHTGMKIDLKVVEPDQFGNVLQHFTGSKAHNVALRENAVRRGLHISEYGILDDETDETLRCASEEDVYARLGLPWIPPELREGRGELEAARDGALPDLVTLADLKGDLHMHTTASDGLQTAEEMAAAARDRGLEYVAITDHSASHGFGTDGSLDYPDELLERLDWVVASVHTSFRMRSKEMTDRMVAAIEHPLVDAIGHPTGRKIEKRQPYALDVDRVIEAAARTGTMLEINAAPDRRDLDEIHAREAARAGVRILVDSDAHSTVNLGLLRFGIDTARRAWLTPEQVANTRPWSEFRKLRKRAARASPGTRRPGA